jgi:hypothetical protein
VEKETGGVPAFSLEPMFLSQHSFIVLFKLRAGVMITFLMRNRKSRRAISMRAWVGLVLIITGLAFLTFHLRDSVLRGDANKSFISTPVVQELNNRATTATE